MTLDSAPDKVAVIDIGSNSVRMVIYALHGSAALPYFNEKAMPSLGVGLSETGLMEEPRMIKALATLRRFKAILVALDVHKFDAVATAAVRRAENGGSFSRRAEQVLGQPLKVLSGEDEARLATLGVIAGTHQPQGLVGDLGGSSVELQSVGDLASHAGESFQLGPLALGVDTPFVEAQARGIISNELEKSQWLKSDHKRFYAVGGAWRAIAKFHMDVKSYPLRVLNGYSIPAKDFHKTLKTIIQSPENPSTRSKLQAINKRRVPTLPHAAVLLDEIILKGSIEEIVISSNGLREGVVRESFVNEIGDPLLEGTAAYARLDPFQRAFAEALYGFVRPAIIPETDLFGSLNAKERIDRAACLLADLGGLYHPDHRAQMAFDNALRAPFAAVTHAERCFIAHAVATRYSRKFRMPDAYRPLITTEQRNRARQLGACMRLGAIFSGRSAPILKKAALFRSDGELRLQVKSRSEAMVSNAVERAFAQAADYLSLTPRISFI